MNKKETDAEMCISSVLVRNAVPSASHPYFSRRRPSSSARLTGGIEAPGRPSTISLPLRTRVRNGSGKPCGGWPMRPCAEDALA